MNKSKENILSDIDSELKDIRKKIESIYPKTSKGSDSAEFINDSVDLKKIDIVPQNNPSDSLDFFKKKGVFLEQVFSYLKLLERRFEDYNVLMGTTVEHSSLIENELLSQQELVSALHQRYEFIVNTSKDWMCLINEDYNFEAVNDSFFNAFSTSSLKNKFSMIGKDIESFMGNGEFEALFKPAIDKALGGVDVFETLNMDDKSGVNKCYDLTFYPYRGPQSEITQVVFIARDVTERTEALDTVKEQAQLLDNARDAIFILDIKGLITYWNKSCEDLYGWTGKEVLNKKRVFQLLTKEHSKEARQIIKTVNSVGDWNGEMCQKMKDGELITVESKWTQLDSTRLEDSSILVINTNISERKKLEQQFFRVQRMESIGMLASGIAHDLNNILSPFFLAISALQPKLADSSGQPILNLMEASANRGAQLVKQILAFAKGNPNERKIINILDVFSDIESMIKETFPKNINFGKVVSESIYRMSGDMTQIHQVFLNLCLNARDAMPSGGALDIVIENMYLKESQGLFGNVLDKGAYLRITCKDTGIGMSSETLEHVMEPFFTTKEEGKGTGLGLSTVLTIVKKHEGILDIQSELGKGTSITVVLPAMIKKKSMVKSRQTLLPFGNGETILFVDDDPSIRNIGKAMLETYGYKVLSASNGKNLLRRHQKEIANAELMVVDLEMPEMDGPEAINRCLELNSELKVIAMSGQSLDSVKLIKRKRNLKYDEFLFKPYTSELLLEKIKGLLIDR
ncbi:PAS domain S-box protein [bacterium]|jgi:two-component system, cell cycle sensor histidine kinase and response regulator CckA|nr:PAS domain S-box protein [bacterium]